MSDYDVAVIGGGAAGLSAALVLSRARRRVLVVDAGSPRNAAAARMHGFLSRDGNAPGELLAAGRREVNGYGHGLLARPPATLAPATTPWPPAHWGAGVSQPDHRPSISWPYSPDQHSQERKLP